VKAKQSVFAGHRHLQVCVARIVKVGSKPTDPHFDAPPVRTITATGFDSNTGQ
jgi:hypothetical protein